MIVYKRDEIRLCIKRNVKFYLVPLELQTGYIRCKLPQVRANDLSRGKSEEDLHISDVPSSCLLHNGEVDGHLSTVGVVPAGRAWRREHPQVMGEPK